MHLTVNKVAIICCYTFYLYMNANPHLTRENALTEEESLSMTMLAHRPHVL